MADGHLDVGTQGALLGALDLVDGIEVAGDHDGRIARRIELLHGKELGLGAFGIT